MVAAVTQERFDPADPRVLDILALVSPVDCEASVSEGVAHVAPSAFRDDTTARLLGFASHATGNFEQSFDLLLQATDRLRSQGQVGLLAQVLVVRAWDAIHTGRFDEALRNADDGGRLARETSQPVWTAGSRIAQALLLGVRGDYALAETLLAKAEHTITPLQLSNLITVAQLTRGLIALTDGRYGEAFDLLPRMFQRSSPASPRSGSPAPRVNCAIACGVKLRPMFPPQPPTATVCRNPGNTCRPNASIVSNRSSPRWTGDSKIRWSIPMRSASRMSSRTCSILPRNGSRSA